MQFDGTVDLAVNGQVFAAKNLAFDHDRLSDDRRSSGLGGVMAGSRIRRHGGVLLDLASRRGWGRGRFRRIFFFFPFVPHSEDLLGSISFHHDIWTISTTYMDATIVLRSL